MRILFVCLGNICRSPMAEGVFRSELARRGLDSLVEVDSAGTSDWHIGEPPDPRARRAAAARGHDISALRGRQATRRDMAEFDLILAMDRENLEHLRRLAGPQHAGKVRLFLEFAPDTPEEEVPDPYYGGEEGFEYVLDLLEAAARGLADHVEAELSRRGR
jgi:protein-tyrosine phosphatase